MLPYSAKYSKHIDIVDIYDINRFPCHNYRRKIQSVTNTLKQKVLRQHKRRFKMLTDYQNWVSSVIQQTSKLVVSYNWSIDDLFHSMHLNSVNLYHVDRRIRGQKFESPSTNRQVVEVGVFEFKGKNEGKMSKKMARISSIEVITEMSKAEYRPATAKELLAWIDGGGASESLVALGSTVNMPSGPQHFTAVVWLNHKNHKMGIELDLLDYNNPWYCSQVKFLAVKI